jgi:SET family sugar efflux transporter-like MFS transporter
MSVAVRALGRVAVAVLLLGIADSMAGSYLVLFAANDAGLSAVQTGVFMSAPAAGSIVASFFAGRGFDRRPSRAYAAVAALAGAAGYAVLLLTSSFALMLAVGVLLLGAVGATFPQLFALARLALAGSAAEHRAAPLLRSGWSLAWAVGPLLGALIVAGGSLRAVLAASAGVLVATAAVVLAAPVPTVGRGDAGRAEAPPPRHPPAPLAPALLTASVALFFTAMYAGSVALPLYVTRTMDRPASDVGLLYSACAFVEVLAALALALVPARVSQKLLIVGAMVVFAGYFALTVTGSFELVVVGQIARGIGIAVVGAAGIRYFQDLSGAAVGRATTLFANATTAGGLIAGVLAGVSNEYLGYLGTLALCGVAALAAAVLFAGGRVTAR